MTGRVPVLRKAASWLRLERAVPARSGRSWQSATRRA